ncbi:hypothetical protein PHYBLDRAFT_170181 [Phycomyces blakesleeanus NRRL 1555(-)]|uniref:Uncharacterized protein n=1 Tax=Phycomyces blakesleeanus (strain ATCC 8743b / DSM 1359 / FGSC 10004 / NBRC 33097 / NRRL 1555) TaxID=763407 RepID=A0A162TWE5_PHYB8|nr:hypothetical protein PHYBLDRAFT_170181 [Phycomyces blakesleeanus NRRL 1555(-)]OAD71512.1 hypothetical protein PHYBLDRAFT_170181 [Phycomyces blakesleeanus NRRL 1555(-)]|eukprot:XP_018289552.1 hypothetical protein PHYBLDRAFT_170181 [Phycomyces blakesleeanus NRRL 1555(-)]
MHNYKPLSHFLVVDCTYVPKVMVELPTAGYKSWCKYLPNDYSVNQFDLTWLGLALGFRFLDFWVWFGWDDGFLRVEYLLVNLIYAKHIIIVILKSTNQQGFVDRTK